MKENQGLKNKAIILTLHWDHTTELRCNELISIFMLSLIGNKYNPNSIGLYRDEGSTVFKNKSGAQSERIKKRLFKKYLRTKV